MKYLRNAAALLLCAILTSCSAQPPQVVTTEETTDSVTEPVTEPTPADLKIGENGESRYVILYSESETYGRTTAFRFYRQLRERLKLNLDLVSDKDSPTPAADACEIVIGRADRDECSAIRKTLSEGQFAIAVRGNSLYLIGKDEEGTSNAVDWFLEHCIGTKTGELKVPGDLDFHSGEDMTPVLEWEKSRIFLTKGGYARMIMLKNGTLMMAYSSGNNIHIRISETQGKTWSNPITVTKTELAPTGETLTVANANIFEAEDGTLFASYRAHSPTNTKKQFYTSIRVQLSHDGGKTWEERMIIAEYTQKDSAFSGFWEPYMMTLPDGRTAVYYANDCVGTGDYPFVPSQKVQHIMMHIFDTQTGTFGEPIIASNGTEHQSRDGMPIVCRLSDGGCVMVIEANNEKDYVFVIQMLFSEDGIHWSEPVTVYRPTLPGYYCGAPFVTLLPDGRLAVSCQATQYSGTTTGTTNTRNSVMNVLISKEAVTMANCSGISTESFEKVNPNPIVPGNEGYSVWPGMCVSGDYLLCYADVGYNTATGTTSSGIYLRRALLTSIKEN